MSETRTSGGRAALSGRVARRLGRVPAELGKLAYRSGLRSAGGLTLPDFLGIGFMKCGTTWLYENLRLHPDIFMSDEKEIRYFSGAAYWGSLADYAAKFASAGDRLAGEISPPYAWLPPSRIALIRRVMPEARFLLMLRDPVARDWSRARHLFASRGAAIEEAAHDDILAVLREGSALRHGGYTGVIDRWSNAFGEDHLFVGLYEHIAERPEELFRRVCAFLGVRTDLDWSAFPLRKVIVPPTGDRYAGHDSGRGVVAEDHRPSGAWFPERYRAFLRDHYAHELGLLHARYGDDILIWQSAREVVGVAEAGGLA